MQVFNTAYQNERKVAIYLASDYRAKSQCSGSISIKLSLSRFEIPVVDQPVHHDLLALVSSRLTTQRTQIQALSQNFLRNTIGMDPLAVWMQSKGLCDADEGVAELDFDDLFEDGDLKGVSGVPTTYGGTEKYG